MPLKPRVTVGSASSCSLSQEKEKGFLAAAWTFDRRAVMKESLVFHALKISDQFKIRHSDRETRSVKRWELLHNKFEYPTKKNL